jgi:hypothetical protein
VSHIFTFGFVVIGLNAQPQIHENLSGVAPPLQRHVAAERFIASKSNQKMFDRAFQELSIGVFKS